MNFINFTFPSFTFMGIQLKPLLHDWETPDLYLYKCLVGEITMYVWTLGISFQKIRSWILFVSFYIVHRNRFQWMINIFPETVFLLNDLLIVFPTASFLQVQSLQGLDFWYGPGLICKGLLATPYIIHVINHLYFHTAIYDRFISEKQPENYAVLV